jgi:hypothetical protein
MAPRAIEAVALVMIGAGQEELRARLRDSLYQVLPAAKAFRPSRGLNGIA